jgi:hypothetical protein
MPTIDHNKQRLRLQNIIDNSSQALIDSNLSLTGGKGLFSKIPKTMSFVGGIPGMPNFSDTTPFSPSSTTFNNGTSEEAKVNLKSKSITTRKKVLASRTSRGDT